MPETAMWERGGAAAIDPGDGERLATSPDTTDRRATRRDQLFRRAFAVLLALFLLGGLLRAYGVLTRTATARGGGFELDVRYGRVTRPGLATPLEITVRSLEGSFDGPVRVAVSGEYLDQFDENGIDPDPASATADDVAVLWEFDPPPGPVLRVSLDVRVEPAVQWGRDGFVALLADDGDELVRVAFHTWVLP